MGKERKDHPEKAVSRAKSIGKQLIAKVREAFAHEEVLLDQTRWEHIIEKHPEMAPHRGRVLATLRKPQHTHRSEKRPTDRLYYKRYSNVSVGKHMCRSIWLVVVVDLKEKRIRTAYFTSRRGERISKWLTPKIP